MEFLYWLLTGLLGGLLGILLVTYLSAHPLRMSLHLAAALTIFFILLVVLTVEFEGLLRLLAILLALGAFSAGYMGMTKKVLARKDTRLVPELTRQPGDPGLGHTAVVYFTHGEPETYDPIGWINQFNEFDRQGIRFIPLFVRPLFFHLLRKKYLQVGRSDHRRMHQRMLSSLESAYRKQGDARTKFYLSFLDDEPRPDAAAIQALNEGASKIIVSEVFLTISNHTAEGKAYIQRLNIEENFRLPVAYTGPLYDSDDLKRMFVHRANAHIGDTDKSKVGILLVGHGQPDEWDAQWPTETEQELGFRCAVLDLLAASGYRRENLSLAWAAFKKPRPAEIIPQFLHNGIEKLLFFPAAISADAMISQLDIPEMVHKADFPPGFPVVDLGAWNDDPLVIRAIKEKIDLHMETA